MIIISPEDVAALELSNIEYRFYGETDDGVDKLNLTCDMWSITVCADGSQFEMPHCDDSAARDSNGTLEGIGGMYARGGTFSYISDDHELSDRYNALVHAKIT
jgi:hypothetical protein